MSAVSVLGAATSALLLCALIVSATAVDVSQCTAALSTAEQSSAKVGSSGASGDRPTPSESDTKEAGAAGLALLAACQVP